jgi:hypothetical protein
MESFNSTNFDDYLIFDNNTEIETNNSFTALLTQICIGILLYSLTIWTIIGNIFVWIALFTNRQLKQGGMSNYLIGNLALSDLLLGLTVLPLSATSSTLKNWVFGSFLCDVWLSIDVLCCTASIWGLLVIAIDRYIATNHPIIYRQHKNSVKTAIIYCTISWIVSLAISIPPFVHDLHSSINNKIQYNNFSESEVSKNLKSIGDNKYECLLYVKASFVIASSLGSFYIPLILMVLLYAKVFIRIRQQSKMFKDRSNRNKNINKLISLDSRSKIVYDDSETKSFRTNNGETSSKNFRNTRLSSFTTENSPCYVADKEKYKNIYNKQTSTDSSVIQLTNVKFRETLADSNLLTVNGSEIVPVTSISLNNHSTRKSQMRISTTEARITKTLAVIIFLFVLCWCPFFTAYIIRSQDETQISPVLMDVFIWLGYFNSALNPILYAILNNNFRTAFKDILSCACCIKRRSN